MIIQMSRTVRGCGDGFKVEAFTKGNYYEIGNSIHDSVAREFVNRGYAEVFNPAGKE